MERTLTLTAAEATLLATHLGRQIEHLDRELVRTDRAAMQHALAREIETLQAIAARLAALG